MKRLAAYTMIFLLIFAPTLTWGQEWKIDPNHSSIRFGVKHIFSTIWGSFSDFEGKIEFDPENLAQSAFDFTVKVKSINTDNAKRDTHLRSDDFFSAGKFPVMKFKSSRITHIKEDLYLVSGTMTLRKRSISMDIPFTFHGSVQSPFNKKEMISGFDTDFTLDRLAFGVGDGKFHKMGVVGDRVRVLISIEAVGKI
jgi:polyisoprenoid-binding protein YceI